MSKYSYDYKMPVDQCLTVEKQTVYDVAGNLAMFLLENTGTVLGKYKGNIRAADQRKLFGRFIGKGTLIVDGDEEMIWYITSACFGLDHNIEACKWVNFRFEAKRSGEIVTKFSGL